MFKRISFLSLGLILIPTISSAYLVAENNYFKNEKDFKPSSISEIKKMPTAFIGDYVILKTKIKEVSLDKRPFITQYGSGAHSYLKLKCSGMVDDYEEKIQIFIDPDDFKMNVGEISKKLIPIMNKLIFLYGRITQPGSHSYGKDAQIYVFAIRSPNEQIPNIPKETSKVAFAKLIEDGPKMLNLGNNNISSDEKRKKIRELRDLLDELEGEDRKNINIQVLEAFMNLKYWLVLKYGAHKKRWKELYQKIVNSGNSEATPMLLRILKDHDPWARLYAADILGKIGDESALDDLKRLTLQENERNRNVRKYAHRAHTQISSRSRKIQESQDLKEKRKRSEAEPRNRPKLPESPESPNRKKSEELSEQKKQPPESKKLEVEKKVTPSSPPSPQAPSQEALELEALRQLLFEKGIMTEEELIARSKKLKTGKKVLPSSPPPSQAPSREAPEVPSKVAQAPSPAEVLKPGPPYDLAILPWRLELDSFRLRRSREFWMSIVIEALSGIVDKNNLFIPLFSCYELDETFDTKMISNDILKNDITDSLWGKKKFFSSFEPNIDLVSQIGRQLKVDAVLMYDLYINSGTDFIKAYLIDVKRKKIYRARGSTGTFMEEADREIKRLTKKVFSAYENEQKKRTVKN
jgi:hypothetical protein